MEKNVTGAANLEREFARFAQGAGGEMGVTVLDPDTGLRISLRGGERFPMASTLKIALAGALLEKIDRGELRLDQMMEIPQDKFVPGSILATHIIHPGISLSIVNLLELMIVQSDNTATDTLMDLAGGPAAATAWLRSQGIADQRVDRSTIDHMRDFFGFGPGPYAQASAEVRRRNPNFWDLAALPQAAYDNDPRDTTTPDAMADLLARITRGQALSASSTALLLEIMGRCQTGPQRIPGLLPKGTPVAYKTGTMGGSVNAVGVITLPDGRGRIIVAAYVKKSDRPRADRERAIAEVSRAAYDFFLTR